MKYFRYLYFFLFLLASINIFAQKEREILINLKGILISKYDSLPIPYAHIFNPRTHGGTISDADGRFSVQMHNTDSLSIYSLGYLQKIIVIPSNYKQDSILVISIQPVRFVIDEIEVIGKSKINTEGWGTGKPVDISPELRGDAFHEKPHWLASVISPVSFFRYYLSAEEKRKRMARQAIATQKDWEQLSLLYNKKLVMSITGLNDKDAEDFMIWFNAKSLLNFHSTEYEVRLAITQQYRIYKKE